MDKSGNASVACKSVVGVTFAIFIYSQTAQLDREATNIKLGHPSRSGLLFSCQPFLYSPRPFREINKTNPVAWRTRCDDAEIISNTKYDEMPAVYASNLMASGYGLIVIS